MLANLELLGSNKQNDQQLNNNLNDSIANEKSIAREVTHKRLLNQPIIANRVETAILHNHSSFRKNPKFNDSKKIPANDTNNQNFHPDGFYVPTKGIASGDRFRILRNRRYSSDLPAIEHKLYFKAITEIAVK